jgi:hypothetical protein
MGFHYNIFFGATFKDVFVDLQGVNIRSLYADDNGVCSTSSPRNYLIIELENGMVSKVTSSTQHNFTHFVRRQYGTHQNTAFVLTLVGFCLHTITLSTSPKHSFTNSSA